MHLAPEEGKTVEKERTHFLFENFIPVHLLAQQNDLICSTKILSKNNMQILRFCMFSQGLSG